MTLKLTIAVCCTMLCSLSVSAEEAQAPPVLEFAMAESLGFSENALSIDSESIGAWSVQGIATGMSFRQTNPTAINSTSYSGFSNAQALIQKTSGPVRLLVQTGLYSIPMLGVSYLRAQPNTETSFGYLPQAYVSIAPDQHWSLAVGKIPSMGGVEATFTYQNVNIQRGLLWIQTNSVSQGVQLNFADGPISAAATWNDGAYSGVYNWIGGQLGWQASQQSAFTLSWTGSLSGNARNTSATPLLQNNSQIGNLIYQYTDDAWTITPYLQYTYVPERTDIGIMGSSGTFGVAMISTYHVTPKINGVAPKHHMSVPMRLEYQSSHGNSAVAGNSAGLMYGPGSSAWSATVTPTMQWNKLFARAEFSYVKVFSPLAESAFGANGLNNNQVRIMLEAGLLY